MHSIFFAFPYWFDMRYGGKGLEISSEFKYLHSGMAFKILTIRKFKPSKKVINLRLEKGRGGGRLFVCLPLFWKSNMLNVKWMCVCILYGALVANWHQKYILYIYIYFFFLGGGQESFAKSESKFLIYCF